MKPLPNRLAVYVTALGALCAGLLPLVGNLDWESTAGILVSIVSITGVVAVWLYNWGKWERGEGAAAVELEAVAAETIPPIITEAPAGTTYTQRPPVP